MTVLPSPIAQWREPRSTSAAAVLVEPWFFRLADGSIIATTEPDTYTGFVPLYPSIVGTEIVLTSTPPGTATAVRRPDGSIIAY